MRPSRPTTRLIRSRSRLCRSCNATSSLNCSTTSLAGPSRRARRTSKRPRRTCASAWASSTSRGPSSTGASLPGASSSTTAGVPGSAGTTPRVCRVAVMTASTCREFEADAREGRPAWAPPKRLQQTARVPLRLERRMRFPPDIQSIRRVRRIIHDMLAEAADGGPAGDGGDVPEFVDDVVLLVSELCENAVLHAGTAFDVAVVADDGRGHRGRHRPRPGRAGAAPGRAAPALRAGRHPRSRPVPGRAAGHDLGHPARRRRPAHGVVRPRPATRTHRRAGGGPGTRTRAHLVRGRGSPLAAARTGVPGASPRSRRPGPGARRPAA